MHGRFQYLVWSAILLCLGCPHETPRTDAGAVVIEAGHVDAGISDLGNPDTGVRDLGARDAESTCEERCTGQCYKERCIEPRQRVCDSNTDCPSGQQCSILGACYTGECLTHGDCATSHRCAMARCLNRADPEEGIIFERVLSSPLNDHVSPLNIYDQVSTYGFGAALFDIDGDLDLDVFIGSQTYDNLGSPSCVYRNVSTPSEPRFEAIAEHCQVRPDPAIAAYGFDVEGDGYHELIVARYERIELHRFYPEHQVTDLRALLPPDDPGLDCRVFAVLAFDLNYDGLSDLVLGCGSRELTQTRDGPHHMHPNIALIQRQDGQFTQLLRRDWDSNGSLLLDAVALTHAIGAADVDHDGLLDLMVSDEAFFAPRTSSYIGDPGGVYRRCHPNQDCQFEPIRLGAGLASYGAYMGSGLLQVEDYGELLYYTNLGPNRLIEVDSGFGYDTAFDANASIDSFGAELVFSWGVVIDDYNRDGRDDLFVSNGSLFFRDQAQMDAYYDTLLLQQPDGTFTIHSEDVGITPFNTTDSRSEDRRYSSRATIKTDWDYDGFVDLLTVGLEGVPRLHREVPTQRTEPPRCTLVPVNRYVPSFGFGYSIVSDQDNRPRRWDSQGQHRSSASPFVMTPWSTGTLRFPSGAEVRYDCQNKAGPFVVHEPEWLRIESSDATLSLATSEGAPPGIPSIFIEPAAQIINMESINDRTFRVRLPAGTERYMIRFGSRWLARWFDR